MEEAECTHTTQENRDASSRAAPAGAEISADGHMPLDQSFSCDKFHQLFFRKVEQSLIGDIWTKIKLICFIIGKKCQVFFNLSKSTCKVEKYRSFPKYVQSYLGYFVTGKNYGVSYKELRLLLEVSMKL